MKRFAQFRQVFSFLYPPERTTLSSNLVFGIYKKHYYRKIKTILVCIHFLLALFKWKAISLY